MEWSVISWIVEVKEIQKLHFIVSLCLFQRERTIFKCTVSYVLVSEEEQSKGNKKESGDTVQEEERQSKPNTKKCGLTGVSNKPTKGSSQVLTKKRKMVEKLEKKKRKKEKIRMMQWISDFF